MAFTEALIRLQNAAEGQRGRAEAMVRTEDLHVLLADWQRLDEIVRQQGIIREAFRRE